MFEVTLQMQQIRKYFNVVGIFEIQKSFSSIIIKW